MGARYYAPAIGRFLTRDPIGFAGGINLYAYCNGDPINHCDAAGTDPFSDYAGQSVAFLEGEISACNPVNWARGIYGAFNYGYRNHFSDESFMHVAHSMWDGLQFWNKEDPHEAGASFMGDVLLLAPLAKRIPAPAALSALCRFGADAPAAAAIASTVAEAANAVTKCGGCFVAGTPVQCVAKRPDGKYYAVAKPIEQIKKGDLVLARNEKTGKTQVRRVPQTIVRHTDLVLTVALADSKTHRLVDTITASREHPFYLKGKGFVPAGGLAVGNAIVTRAGPALIVQSIKWNRRPEGYTVYNFVVEDDHSYFVGKADGGAWVHNPGVCWTSPGGLVYELGSAQGNRVLHIFEHLAENPTKNAHGVFNVESSGEVLDLVDEAWARRGAPIPGDPGAYLVNMNRAIGTEGQPFIKLVVIPGTNRVITAYPHW